MRKLLYTPAALYATFPDGSGTDAAADAAPAAPKRKAAAKKKKPKAKSKPKSKKRTAKKKTKARKPSKAKKPAKKTKAKKKAGVGPERSERVDVRLTKAEKARLNAKAKKLRRTVTSVVLEAIEKIR